jgi:hypothetical protein
VFTKKSLKSQAELHNAYREQRKRGSNSSHRTRFTGSTRLIELDILTACLWRMIDRRQLAIVLLNCFVCFVEPLLGRAAPIIFNLNYNDRDSERDVRRRSAQVVAFCCLLIEIEILHELQIFVFARCNSMQIQYNTIKFKEPRTANKYHLWKNYLLTQAM